VTTVTTQQLYVDSETDWLNKELLIIILEFTKLYSNILRLLC